MSNTREWPESKDMDKYNQPDGIITYMDDYVGNVINNSLTSITIVEKGKK